MAICIDIAPKSALGKKKVVLELIFAHFRACPGLRIWHDKRVDVLPLYTDLGRKFITFSTLNFRKFTSFPSKMKQRQRFQASGSRVFFNIPRCNRLSRYIGPNILTSRCGIVLGGWRAVINYFRYYPDILVSITALNRDLVGGEGGRPVVSV